MKVYYRMIHYGICKTMSNAEHSFLYHRQSYQPKVLEQQVSYLLQIRSNGNIEVMYLTNLAYC